jgi:hypothetical protein
MADVASKQQTTALFLSTMSHAQVEELEANSKINNIRDFYRGIVIVKDEKGDSIADSHSIIGGGTISPRY